MTRSILAASPSRHTCIAALVLLLSSIAEAQVPSFTGVGDLPGGAVGSEIHAMSADGSAVVGSSESASGTEAFQWTAGGGLVGLGFLSGGNPHSVARAISDDGTVIAGSSLDGGGVMRAFRYSGGSFTALNTLSCSSCDPVTEGNGLSGDGLVVVGSAAARSGGSSPLTANPVRWAGGGTGISDLGNLSGGDEIGAAFGASPDGSLIVGNHMTGSGKEAFYWAGSGLNLLPTLIGGSIITASGLAVSDDESTLIGYSNLSTLVLPGGTEVATDLQAVRWTGAGYGTIESLGNIPGSMAIDSEALATVPDGSIIVGRAVDSSLVDRAFIWTTADGMRDLKTVLSTDYGLEVEGWILSAATAISDPVGGDFFVAGTGINPQGDTEGWIALLSVPACSDGLNNDGDAFTDHPADPGCTGPTDWSEELDCEDGLDNDGDGDVDHPTDTGCNAANDPTEEPDCADGIDNDGDLLVDYPADPGCAEAMSTIEDPACSDGVDNDLDLNTDYPDDLECLSASDLSEVPDCSDGLDNDGDGSIDFPADLECKTASDASEAGQCSDALDNDGDGRIDYPEQYPGCVDALDPIEAPQCADGVDNDNDGDVDFPDDAGCTSPLAASESPFLLQTDQLIALDRKSRTVFAVDTTTGAQTLISQAAFLQAPQGIAQRDAELVVADPIGLVSIAPSGRQRLASDPLDANESLQLVFDGAGDALVLEATEISKVTWSAGGPGTKSTFMAMPTPEPIPVIGLWHGDALALESSGDLLVTGLSLFGDGVFRIDAGTASATILLPGFDDLMWLDLAVEADGTILAVGFEFDQGTGLYRVDPVTGVATALNNTYGWQTPTGVAIDASGDVYVADAGVCADGSCTGGQIVHVDPVSGTATQLSTGGFLAGEIDLVVVPEPGLASTLGPGLLALVALRRRRARRPAPRKSAAV